MSTQPATTRASLEDTAARVPTRASAAGAMLAAAVIFGSAAVPAKLALEHIPPFVLAELRWLIALSILLVILARRGERPVINRATWLLGLTGLTLFYLFYSYGLRRTTAANTTLISGGTPVLVALLSAIFLGERTSGRKAVGIMASLAGVAVIVSAGTGLDSSLTGNVLIVGSATSWAIYTVIGRRAFVSGSSMALLAGTAIAGLILMAPIAAYEVKTDGVSQIGGVDLLYVLYLAIGPSLLAYILWGYGLSHLEASQASVYGNLMPLSGAVAGYVFLDERIGIAHLIGGACIILGVWLATRAGRVTVRATTEREIPHGAIEQRKT